ncbi:MAG: molybdenum cofactor guanylyltransferase [Dehalococcoidia bacterium]
MPESPRPRRAAIVLAGGRSSRMGIDKAALVVEGRTLLQRAIDAVSQVVEEVVVVGAPGGALPEVEASIPLRRVDDTVEGEGPLAGISAGLAAIEAPVTLVVGCDMPWLQPALLELLLARVEAGARLVVPLSDGRPEGLCSAWRVDALPVVRAHFEAGDRRVMSVAGDLEAVRLKPGDYAEADPDGRSFRNLNTPDEFARAASDLEG